MNTTPVVASCSQGSQSSPASINSHRPIDPAMSWDGVCQRLEDKMRDFLHEVIPNLVHNELCNFFRDMRTSSAFNMSFGARQV